MRQNCVYLLTTNDVISSTLGGKRLKKISNKQRGDCIIFHIRQICVFRHQNRAREN